MVALVGCGGEPRRVVLVGDSITVGTSSQPHGPGYAELLVDRLGPGYEIVAVACSGSSSLDWVPDTRRAPCAEAGGIVPLYATRARPALPADAAVILLGTNDLVGGFELAPVEPDAYGDALRALADALHADGARLVVLMAPPFQYGTDARLSGYRARIQALCRDRAFLRCGPDLSVLLDLQDFEPLDAHPNASGHAKTAAALAETLRALERD